MKNKDQARDHFSKTNSSIVELDATRTTARTLAMHLKLSRRAEVAECSAYATLRNRIKPAKHSKKEVLTSIGEDMGAVSRNIELLRFRLGNDTQNLRNPGHCWTKHRPRVFSGKTTPRR